MKLQREILASEVVVLHIVNLQSLPNVIICEVGAKLLKFSVPQGLN